MSLKAILLAYKQQKGGEIMASPNREISIHKCIFAEQSKKVKEAMAYIIQKDSLSTGDTKAIKLLTEVYEVLINPVRENRLLHQEADNNGHSEAFQ